MGTACLLLVLCLIPHIGVRVNGSPRWLRVAGWTYQPSELAKLALILFLSWWMGKNQRHIREFKQGFLWPLLICAPLLLLVAKQQDLGSTAIMVAIVAAILFSAGTRWIYAAWVPLLGLAGIVATSLLIPERMARWRAFFHPEHALNDKGYQQLQALIALGSGGLSGLGPRQQPPEDVLPAGGQHRLSSSRSSARRWACGWPWPWSSRS